MSKLVRASLQKDIGKKRPFDSIEQEAFLNLLRSASTLDADFHRLFKSKGLSLATYNVLRIIRGETDGQLGREDPVGVSCQTIGQRLVTRVPDVTRLVDRLEQAGLVKRERSPADRRVVLVCLTRRGLDLLASLDKPVLELHKAQVRHMSRAELTELNRLLVKIRHPEET